MIDVTNNKESILKISDLKIYSVFPCFDSLIKIKTQSTNHVIPLVGQFYGWSKILKDISCNNKF